MDMSHFVTIPFKYTFYAMMKKKSFQVDEALTIVMKESMFSDEREWEEESRISSLQNDETIIQDRSSKCQSVCRE